jgi:hypothetical protein
VAAVSPRARLALLALTGASILGCAFDPGYSSTVSTGMVNAIWNCPTATPPPTPSPIPTVCTAGEPGPDGTPGPEDCTKPALPPTPLPTATPYGRWMSPGDRASSDTFYAGQDVRIGGLKLTLTGYRTAAIAGQPTVAHVWTFAVVNEGGEDLDIQWPLQTYVAEVQGADGTTTAGRWWQSPASEAAAGLPAWTLERGALPPGAHQGVTVAQEGPAGRAHAVGFLPDPTGGDVRDGLGQAAHILWFVPQADPYCPDGNTSGPPRQHDGGLVYPKALPSPASAPYGYFAGWPIAPNGPWTLSQGFGCTAFHEISGFACPNEAPWYHSGIDVAALRGTPLLSVVQGVVSYIGPSSGSRECTVPGADPPRTNLGWMVQIQPVDSAGRPAPFVVKYGHLIVNSQRVQQGDPVAPGQVLGLVGSTGCSTGPHTHFMVQQGSTFLNPMTFIGPPRR